MSECIHRSSGPAQISTIVNGLCEMCGAKVPWHEDPPTLQPFDKMQPGEVDKVFRATCPKCDGRVWIFMGTGTGEQALRDINPDVRQCENCGYVHWLRGPNESEVIPLPVQRQAAIEKKDRVRALVTSMLESPCAYLFFGKFDGSTWIIGPVADAVDFAKDLDREIEGTK
jgi:hypothetical protein